MPHDCHPCLQFCQWLVWEQKCDASFVGHILWIDKAEFTHWGVFNKFIEALMCGPVSLTVVWLGYTYSSTVSFAVCILCFFYKFYQSYLKMCHCLFAMMCCSSTMWHRPSSISAYISMVDRLDVVALYHSLWVCWTWISWTSLFGDVRRNSFLGIVWHGRLGGKVACCYCDHWCRHFMMGASQYSTSGRMSATLLTPDVVITALQHIYRVLYIACQNY